MSKLSLLNCKGKTYNIGGIELELKPLDLDDMGLFNSNENMTPKEKLMVGLGLIRRTLKKSIPDSTDEEINSISMKYMNEFMEAIVELNDLEEDSSKLDKIKNAIKPRIIKE